jgi:hypothetical protein
MSRPAPNRQWQRAYFLDHPRAGTDDPNAKSGDKTKVICKLCLEAQIVNAQASDLANGLPARPRDILIETCIFI